MKFRNSLVASLLSSSNIRNTCLTIMIFTGVLNYTLLMYNHESEKIIEFFHEKFKIEKQNKTQVVLIITYNILSIIAGIYLSYLIGINKIQALIGPSKIL